MAKNNLKSKTKTKKNTSRKYPFPKKYYQGLTKKDKTKQIKELEKSRDLYKKGIYKGRSEKTSFKSKRSAHLVEFENKYGVNINDSKAVHKVTGITPKAQDAIISKGMGAFYSSGSRPNQSAQSWALARLASVILKHGAYKVDKHILVENNCDNIKPPPTNKIKSKLPYISKKTQKGGKKRKKHKKKGSIIPCCKITEKNESKYKSCRRNHDGKIFNLPRRFNRIGCKRIRGFTMKSSCAPYDSC